MISLSRPFAVFFLAAAPFTLLLLLPPSIAAQAEAALAVRSGRIYTPGHIVVGPNFAVSTADGANAHDEVQIAADPVNPSNLVACSMVDMRLLAERKMHTAVYTSRDGGKSWMAGPAIPQSGDPICGFGPDGSAYFGAIGDSPDNDPAIDWHLQVFRSIDSGIDWKKISEFVAGDRPWLAFDATRSPDAGWLYITYQARAGTLDTEQKQLPVALDLTHSADHGATWSFPVAYGVITGTRLYHSMPTGMATLSDGTVVISSWQYLQKRTAEDAPAPAVTWPGMPGPPTCEIAVTFIDPDGWKRPSTVKAADKYCSESLTTRTVDSLAVDNHPGSPFKDRMYLAWADARDGHSRILFTYSADRGKTWSNPRAVDDVPGNLPFSPDNFMPTLAVNRDGAVGLSWNDRRGNPGGIGYRTRFAASLDGGETWLPSVPVAQRPAEFLSVNQGEPIAGYVENPASGHGSVAIHITGPGEFHAGDTAGLCADSTGVFHPLWVDNRNGRDELYTAAVAVHGVVVPHGSAALASLSELSDRLALELAGIAYDPTTGIVSVEGALRNKSSTPVHGPLVVRVLALTSQAGLPTILNADNGASGPGAVFDFTSLVPAGGLAPKQSTPPRTLKFRLAAVSLPAAEYKNIVKLLTLHFIDADVEILGAPTPPQASPKH